MTKQQSNRPSDSKAPRRHCMVVHAVYPLGETRVQREAEALTRRGFEVDVICLRGENDPPTGTHNGIQIHRLPVRRHRRRRFTVQLLEYVTFFTLAMLKLSGLHLKRHYQTVQVHNPPDFLAFAAWIPKLFGAGVILDIHDPMPEFFTARAGIPPDSMWAKLVYAQESLSCRFSDHVIVISDYWRQTLIDRGVPPEKCSVVMNVADERIFHRPAGSDDNSDRAHEGDGAEFRLLYHGVTTYRYGLDLAIRAVAQVREEIPGIHLTIVGGGDYYENLRQLVAELQLKREVSFKPVMPAEELPCLIIAADAGVVPYRNNVFTSRIVPTKLMEYAAMELPAIAARTAAIEAYFGDTMVEFFEPGDVDDLARCMRMLYHDRGRLKELAQRSQRFNQRYNWAKIGAAYANTVERLGSR